MKRKGGKKKEEEKEEKRIYPLKRKNDELDLIKLRKTERPRKSSHFFNGQSKGKKKEKEKKKMKKKIKHKETKKENKRKRKWEKIFFYESPTPSVD